MPQVILGGIPVTLETGEPQHLYSYAGGRTDVRLSQGKPVAMRSFTKRLITISGSGWVSTGLDSLNWDEYQVLQCSAPLRVSGSSVSLTITADSRPDEPVLAQALVDGHWVFTPVTMTGRVGQITPVTGATMYTLTWYPQFTVLCEPPDEGYGSGAVDWQITCSEV
jgi:hypothetical protein